MRSSVPTGTRRNPFLFRAAVLALGRALDLRLKQVVIPSCSGLRFSQANYADNPWLPGRNPFLFRAAVLASYGVHTRGGGNVVIPSCSGLRFSRVGCDCPWDPRGRNPFLFRAAVLAYCEAWMSHTFGRNPFLFRAAVLACARVKAPVLEVVIPSCSGLRFSRK